MIDDQCPIWQSRKGFCWCPSAAWGKSDDELCSACMLKNMVCRYCGANYNIGERCSASCGIDTSNVISITAVRVKKVS